MGKSRKVQGISLQLENALFPVELELTFQINKLWEKTNKKVQWLNQYKNKTSKKKKKKKETHRDTLNVILDFLQWFIL